MTENMTEKPLPEDLIALAHRLADAAGEVVRRHFRGGFSVDAKEDRSPVTVADRETELAIRAILEKERPQDAVHGEEFGPPAHDSEFLWIIDPIDGTKAFATGRPTFGTLIALYQDGTPVLGVIDQPIVKDRWTGARGHATTHNGRNVRCRPCGDIASAVIATTGADYFTAAEFAAFNDNICKKSAFTLYGGDCYSYGQLACGWLDGVAENFMNLHDFAALIPVVEGAGGTITDWKGKPLGREKSPVLAAGDQRLHAALCAALGAQGG